MNERLTSTYRYLCHHYQPKTVILLDFYYHLPLNGIVFQDMLGPA